MALAGDQERIAAALAMLPTPSRIHGDGKAHGDGDSQRAALIRSASWYASMASIVLANRNEVAMV